MSVLHRFSGFGSVALLLLSLGACSTTQKCEPACSGGKTCFAGRCLALCSADEHCGASESCQDGACLATVCGNGVIEGAEECDAAGSNGNSNLCTAQCTSNVCGDGYVLLGKEVCDDGNDNDNDACTTSCLPSRCGDRAVQLGKETCDDGNTTPGDGCHGCQIEAGFCCVGECVADRSANPGNKCEVCNAQSSPMAWSLANAIAVDGCDQCADGDEDTVCDDVDNCPTVPNREQENGDGDAAGDACDTCPGSNDALDVDGDGLADGCEPRLVGDINNQGGLSSQVTSFSTFKGQLIFEATDGVHGREIFTTNGSPDRVRPLLSRERDFYINTGSPLVPASTAGGDLLFFMAGYNEAKSSLQIWATDGDRAYPISDPLRQATAPQAVPGGATFHMVSLTDPDVWEIYFTDGTRAGVKLSDRGFGDLTAVGDLLFFSEGNLWITDSSLSAYREIDLNPAKNLNKSPGRMRAFDGALYFTSYAEDGNSLWVAEGTTIANVTVRRLTGRTDSPDFPTAPDLLRILAKVGQRVFFTTDDKSILALGKRQLWVYDHNTNKTAKLTTDLRFEPGGPVVFANLLFFNGDGKLWQSDGTAGGTKVYPDFSGSASDLARAGSSLFFKGHDGGAKAWELWRIDDTLGQAVRSDINPNGNSNPGRMTDFGGRLYFTAYHSAHGTEVWRSTPAGAELLSDLNTQTADSESRKFSAAGAAVCFAATTSLTAEDPWCSAEGRQPSIAFDFPKAAISSFIPQGDALWFSTGSSILWSLTTEPISVRELTNFSAAAADFVALGDGVLAISQAAGLKVEFFSDTDPQVLYQTSRKDGAGWFVSNLINRGSYGYVLFRTIESWGGTGVLLLKTDGTAAGTSVVHDNWQTETNGVRSAEPPRIAAVADKIVYAAHSGNLQFEAWSYDMKTGDTVQLIDPKDSGNPEGFVEFDGRVYFSMSNGYNNREVWATDGTTTDSATTQVSAINDGTRARPKELTPFGDHLCFSAAVTDSLDRELFCFTAGQSGAQLLDLNNAGGSRPENLTALGDLMYFSAADPAVGIELFRTDGTAAGTFVEMDIKPGISGSAPTDLQVVGNALWFTAADDKHGREPWRLGPLQGPTK